MNLLKHTAAFKMEQFMRSVEAEITSLRAENERLREALEWYGEQARLCRLVHSEGDKGRHALDEDGGNRARAALKEDN